MSIVVLASIGAAFVVMLTDAVNGLWVARMMSSTDRRAAGMSRWMSAAVAFLCLAIAGPALLGSRCPSPRTGC